MYLVVKLNLSLLAVCGYGRQLLRDESRTMLINKLCIISENSSLLKMGHMDLSEVVILPEALLELHLAYKHPGDSDQ